MDLPQGIIICLPDLSFCKPLLSQGYLIYSHTVGHYTYHYSLPDTVSHYTYHYSLTSINKL